MPCRKDGFCAGIKWKRSGRGATMRLEGAGRDPVPPKRRLFDQIAFARSG